MRMLPRFRMTTKIAIAGTALGAAVTYIFSKPRLRKELQKADSAKEAMDILSRHVQRDTRGLSKEARRLMRTQAVQSRLSSVRRWMGSAKAGVRARADRARSKPARRNGRAHRSEAKTETAATSR